MSVESLVTQLKSGLDAPICLTWELTYACNLQCIHCLSSSGRRDPRELSTEEAKSVIDQLRDMQVFYVNIGGGEPMVRRDFFEIIEYSTANGIGVKFSTNGAYIDPENAKRLAAMDYLDIQISLDGTDAKTNDAIRGEGSFDTAIAAMNNLRDAGFGEFKISVVVTRHNVSQLDAFKELADSYYIDSRADLKKLVIDTAHWQFDRSKLTLSFNPYEVAPYAAGAPEVSLPWASLMPWLTQSVRDTVSRK